MAARGQQVIRQWRLLRILERARNGLTVKELHEACESEQGPRTTYRDIEALQAAGFPIVEEEGRWRMLTVSEGAYAVPISPTELLALSLAQDFTDELTGTWVQEPFSDLTRKLKAILTPKGRAFLASLRTKALATTFAPTAYATREEDLHVIDTAIFEEHRLRIRYGKPGEGETTREVDPYLIWILAGRVYLIAHCHRAGAVRTFALQRITSAEMLDVTFDIPDDFDPAEFTRLGFGAYHGDVHDVVLEFDKAVAYLVRERRYHHTQRLEPLDGGGVRMRMRAAGLPEIAAWLAGFGGKAKVVSPPALRERLRAVHEAGLRAIGGGDELS